MKIEVLDPFDPRALELLAQSDAYHLSLYPPQCCFLVDPASLQAPQACFLGAFEGDTLLGCGAYRRCEDGAGRYAEVKRLFVPAARRGHGAARALMAELEARMVAEGLGLARLETGPYQPEALRLYQVLGYVERGPFGDYALDPMSVFMEKPLPVAAQRHADLPLDALADLLIDCVAAGASIGWVRSPSREAARAYWQRVALGVATGERLLWALQDGARVLASAQLLLEQPENGAHRAEVCKVMTHPDARRRGLAEALLRALEAEARALGKRLLVLDTNTGSAAERLYQRLGWQLCGVMPDYAEQADATLGPTSWMFKRLP